MSTNVAKPVKVAIIGASGTYGKGILARAEEIGVEAVVVSRSPHKFKDVKPTTTVVEAQLRAVVGKPAARRNLHESCQ
jgi:putative NADH-flavin reductase